MPGFLPRLAARSKEKTMDAMDRRAAMKVAGLAATLAVGVGSAAQGQTPPPASGPYGIKPLPFDPKSIKGLSEKILVSHHDNNYAGAVRRLNTIAAQLAETDFSKDRKR